MKVQSVVINVIDLDENDVIVEGKERFTILSITPIIRGCGRIHVEMQNAKTGGKSIGCYDTCGKVSIQDYDAPDVVEEIVNAILNDAVETVVSRLHGLGL